jgi:hypothetical protein
MFVIVPLHPVLPEPLHVYAAGSLTAAFTDIANAFPANAADVATPVFGPSGVLRERIEQGDHVDVLASAGMDQPPGWHALMWDARPLPVSRPREYSVPSAGIISNRI